MECDPVYIKEEPGETECDIEFMNTVEGQLGDVETFHNAESSEVAIENGDEPQDNYESKRMMLLNIKQELAADEDGQLTCYICDFICKDLTEFHEHKRLHIGQKLFPCLVCGAVSKKSGDFKRHKFTHLGVKPFECDQCDYATNLMMNLAKHKKIHSKVRNLFCSICSFATANSESLRKHYRVHSSKKPYECNVCDFACKSASVLGRHRAIHSDVKQYACDICSYASSRSDALRTHRLIHTKEKPHHCTMCGYVCKTPGALATHKRTHSGEKPYGCSICRFTCAQLTSYKRHMQQHTGVRPQQCDQCSYSCMRKDNLQKHKRLHQIPAADDESQNLKTKIVIVKHDKTPNKNPQVRYKRDKILVSEPQSNEMDSAILPILNSLQTNNLINSVISKAAFAADRECSVDVKDEVLSTNSESQCENIDSDLPITFTPHSDNIQPEMQFEADKPYSEDQNSADNSNISSQNDLLKSVLSKSIASENFINDSCFIEYVPDESVINEHNNILDGNKSTAESEKEANLFLAAPNLRMSSNVMDNNEYMKQYQKMIDDYVTENGLPIPKKPKIRKIFGCEICKSTFAQLVTLKRHISTHSNEKPHKCNLCEFACKRKDNLRKHMLKHVAQQIEQEGGEKPYKCDVCSYSAVHITKLKKHSKIHTKIRPNYACTICSYTCRRSDALTKHMVKHTKPDLSQDVREQYIDEVNT